MLGSALFPFFQKANYDVLATDIDLNEPWLKQLDVREFSQAEELCKLFRPDLVCHLAALTSLEYCENHPDEAYHVNYLGTRNMAVLCKRLNIPLAYISTAGVFDGRKDIYSEADIPNPINVYGKTKLYGEILIQASLERYFILRAGWMVGGGRKDKKFVSYIITQAQEGRKTFHVVNDRFGTPTYTKDFARNLDALIRTDYYGLYHMVCRGDASRSEIARCILDVLHIRNPVIQEVNSDFFRKEFSAPRPVSERMINAHLDRRGINLMRDWRDALRDYIVDEWRDAIQ